MTPEQIREAVELAVELAEGWTWEDDNEIWTEGLRCYFDPTKPAKVIVAALASQLISQVDAMDNIHVSTLPRASEVWENIVVSDHDGARCLAHHEGPNRDENSILACTEVLRGRK